MQKSLTIEEITSKIDNLLDKGYTQRFIAGEVGVSPATIHQLINNKQKATERIQKLFFILDVDVYEAIGERRKKIKLNGLSTKKRSQSLLEYAKEWNKKNPIVRTITFESLAHAIIEN